MIRKSVTACKGKPIPLTLVLSHHSARSGNQAEQPALTHLDHGTSWVKWVYPDAWINAWHCGNPGEATADSITDGAKPVTEQAYV